MQHMVCLPPTSTIQYTFSKVFDQVVPVGSSKTNASTRTVLFPKNLPPKKHAYMPLRRPGHRLMPGGVNFTILCSMTPSSHSSDSALCFNSCSYSSLISWRISKLQIMICAWAGRETIAPPCSCNEESVKMCIILRIKAYLNYSS